MCAWHSQKIPANHLYSRTGTCWLWASNQETTFHISGLALEVGPGIQLGGEKGIYTSCECSRALHVRPDSRVMGETSLAHGFVGMWARAAASSEISLQEAGDFNYEFNYELCQWGRSMLDLEYILTADISGLYFWIPLLTDSLVVPHWSLTVSWYTPLAVCKKRAATAGSHKQLSPTGCSSTTSRTEIWRESLWCCCLRVTRTSAAHGCSPEYLKITQNWLGIHDSCHFRKLSSPTQNLQNFKCIFSGLWEN